MDEAVEPSGEDAFQAAVDVLARDRHISSKFSDTGAELLKVSRLGWDHYKVLRWKFNRKERILKGTAAALAALVVAGVVLFVRSH